MYAIFKETKQKKNPFFVQKLEHIEVTENEVTKLQFKPFKGVTWHLFSTEKSANDYCKKLNGGK